MDKFYLDIPSDEGRENALDCLIDSLETFFGGEYIFRTRRCLLVETDNPAIKILLQNLPGPYPVPAPEPLSALEEEHEIDFAPPDVLPQTTTAAPNPEKKMSAKKTFPPRVCTACGKDYTPTGPTQKTCPDCRGETALGQRINAIVERNEQSVPGSADQTTFGKIRHNGGAIFAKKF